jgi:DNA-binding response OmpR family regulator
MDSRASEARTRIVALTGEVGLLRLLRSILEPNACKVVPGALTLDGAATGQPVDIVIVDLESFDRESLDLELLSRLRRAYPGAEMIAISSEYREADCIAILDVDVDYLSRPFRAQNLTARVRVAELRRFKAGGHKRFYRHGSFVVDLFDRTVALDGQLIALAPSELNVLMHLASKPGLVTTFGDILAWTGRAGSASGRRAIRTSVFRLRRRIERDPRNPVVLLTEAGIGYRLARESVDHLTSMLARGDAKAMKPARHDARACSHRGQSARRVHHGSIRESPNLSHCDRRPHRTWALSRLGVPQTLSASVRAPMLESAKQIIALRPAASQETIKLIGDNGGGFFNVNSARPFENELWSSIFQNWSQLVLPVTLVFAFERMVGDWRQGRTRLSLATPRTYRSSRVCPPRSALRKPKDNVPCSSRPVPPRALWAPYDLKLHSLSNAYLGVLILSA